MLIGLSALISGTEESLHFDMSSSKAETQKEFILSVIDQLRRRKARPDLQRITHFVDRKHGLNPAETETILEKLVDQGHVIKVVYKRGTSYRNAAKSRRKSYGAQILNSNTATRRIAEAVMSLTKEKCASKGENASANSAAEGWVSVVGVSGREIESWIAARTDEEGGEPFMCPMHLILQREVEGGRLDQLQNGNYVLAGQASAGNPEVRQLLQKTVNVISKRGRPPKKKSPVMRSLSVGDVSYVTKSPSPPAEEAPPVCDFCQKGADCNRTGEYEELLYCKDCCAKAHPSCMDYSPELAMRAKNTHWQCIDCKTCCICFDPGEADLMLFCDACDKGYHMQCHVPDVKYKPQGKWVCSECMEDGVEVDDADENENNVVDSTVRSDTDSFSSRRDSYDSESVNSKRRRLNRDSSSPLVIKIPKPEDPYPDASQWTVTDVVNFFQEKGFEEQANAFKDQEIDGHSLLLLKRSDVLQGLSLRLGPALKIYNHVMRLQTAGQTFS